MKIILSSNTDERYCSTILILITDAYGVSAQYLDDASHNLDDVYGLEDIKQRLKEIVCCPVLFPHLFKGEKRRGPYMAFNKPNPFL